MRPTSHIGFPVPRPKLDAEQFAPRIAPHKLVRLLDLVKNLGVAPERLYVGLGFSADGLRRGELISNRQVWRMIRRALRLTGRADLGFELSSSENATHFELPGAAMVAARTYGDAVELGVRYRNVVCGVTRSSLEHDEVHLTVGVTSKLRDKSVWPFIVEEYFSSMLTISRHLVGPQFRFHSLEVTYPKPAHAERYRQLFGCPLHFGREFNRARIERHWLSAPIATYCEVKTAQMGAELDQRAQANAIPSRPTVTVEELVLRSDCAPLSIDEVANALQLSVRTLRRRLKEDGTSFRALHSRLRMEAAQRLLREQGMTVAAVAQRLGFSDTRAFRRAFKQWAGQVPGQIRRVATPYLAVRKSGN
jgi:AraC-like DNA-binding protein